MGNLTSRLNLVRSKLRLLVHFFAAQGMVLLGNSIYGILCVRLLPTAEYAKFVLLFAVQGTLVILMDVNFSDSLMPLIGERVDDRKLIADYIASLRRLSYWLYAGMSCLAIFGYPWLVRSRGWSLQTVVEMVVLLLISCWFLRISAAYGTVLILLRERQTWYFGQLVSSFGTLALLGVLWATGTLNGFTAILLNVLGMVFVATYYYVRATALLGTPGEPSREKRRSIIRLALPNVPQAIFYALQGQIALFLIALFGHGSGVASVGALGRINQLFTIFMQMNPLFVAPYFAKLARAGLGRSYAIAMLVAGSLSVGMSLLAASVPGVFLWVLGPKYQDLRVEVVLVIMAGGIACFSDMVGTINSARRFVYWTNNILNIALVIIVQVLFIMRADLSTVRTVLWLNVTTNAVTMLLNVGSAVYGLVIGPRRVEGEPEPLPLAVEAQVYQDITEHFDGFPGEQKIIAPVGGLVDPS